MPIKIGTRTFKKFADAVRYVMRTKNLSKKQAQAYVASIERKQRKR
jgi:hypothetical protein